MNATMTDNQVRYEIVNDSSVECAAYNLTNTDAINLGIIPPRKPSDRVIEREAQEAKNNQQAELRAKLEEAVLAELQSVNPTGVRLSVGAVYSGRSSYSSGYHSGWKLTIGDGYGQDANKKRMAIGNGAALCVTAKQLGKAKEKIAEVAAVDAAEKARRNAKLNVQQRTQEFIKNNSAFCALAGHTSYNSGETVCWGSGYSKQYRYQTAFLVTEDGAVKIGHETYEVAQWVQIFDLRIAQDAAMKALKDSFKPISPVA